MNLLEELSSRKDPALLDGVVSAIGPVARREDVFKTVRAYYLDFTNPDVLAVYLVSAGRAIRYEHATDGTTLTSCLPLGRIARVSQQTDPSKTTVVMETDADRITLGGTAHLRPAAQGGPDQAGDVYLLSAQMFPSAWVIEAAEPGQQQKLIGFAARVRAAISPLATG